MARLKAGRTRDPRLAKRQWRLHAAAQFLREYPGWIREYERAHAMRAALLSALARTALNMVLQASGSGKPKLQCTRVPLRHCVCIDINSSAMVRWCFASQRDS